MKKWVCTVCGYVYEGENPPEKLSTVRRSCFQVQKSRLLMRSLGHVNMK